MVGQVERFKGRLLKWARYIKPQRSRDTEDQLRQTIALRQYLLEAVKNPRFAAEMIPKKLDLGEFGREAERLIQLSLADPEHPEFLSVACLDKAGRLLLLQQPIRGGESSVPLPQFDQKRPVLHIHTHGDTDTPFSLGGDLDSLLVKSDPGKITIPAEMLVTPSMKLLLLRTQRTPLLSSNEVLDATVMTGLNPAMADERDLYRWGYEAAGGEAVDQPPKMTDEFKQELSLLSNKRMYALTRMVQEYHLQLYTCPVNKNIAIPVQ